MNNLLIIIPAYNEGENLINLLKKIESINCNWNIIKETAICNTCSICLEPFSSYDNVSMGAANQWYHSDELTMWIQNCNQPTFRDPNTNIALKTYIPAIKKENMISAIFTKKKQKYNVY